MVDFKSMKVSVENYEWLRGLRLVPNETFDHVLERLRRERGGGGCES
jgi:hypothetical protein